MWNVGRMSLAMAPRCLQTMGASMRRSTPLVTSRCLQQKRSYIRGDGRIMQDVGERGGRNGESLGSTGVYISFLFVALIIYEVRG